MRWLFGPELVAATEKPGPRDDQKVGVAADVGRKGRKRPGELDDLERGTIEHFEARGAVELDAVDAAVGADRHRESQVAVDLAARVGGVVHRSPALDLGAPVLLVLRQA